MWPYLLIGFLSGAGAWWWGGGDLAASSAMGVTTALIGAVAVQLMRSA